MIIENNKVITINFTLKNSEGTLLETTEGDKPFDFLQGAMEILPKLEYELEGKSVGEKLTITLDPDEAYGERNDELVDELSLEEFGPEGVAVGDELQVPMDDDIILLTITKIEGDVVTADMNHPLAGMTLVFDIEILGVRDATKEELEHGHAHSEDNCC